jgi:hypothetical protein
MIKKHHIFGLALLALFAFSAIMAVSASAETTLLAEWLIKEKAIEELTSVEMSGEILYEDTGVKGHVVCSGVYDGSVGFSGEAEITEVLTLEGSVVSLSSPQLCKSASGSACEENATDIEISPEKLPWHVLMYLKENGSFSADVVSEAEHVVTCLDLGLKITDTCKVTGATGEVMNSTFSAEAKGAEAPLGSCSLGGKETVEIEPLVGNTILNLVKEGVFVSSEGVL